jgi:glycosyltransferase involved in cell wall biosynthesis
VRRIIRTDPPALIHANGLKAALVCSIASMGTATPVVWHKHDSARDGLIGRWIARRCDLVVGVSQSSVASLSGVSGVRSIVVRNGIPQHAVDRQRARESVRRTVRVTPDATLISMVGRIHPAKGQLELVNLVGDLRSGLPGVHLLLIGEPDPHVPGYAKQLVERISELRLEDSVSLLGYRPDAVELLAGCDLLAMPSTRDRSSGWREGLPLAPLEAMAVGTPVVGYAEPGIVEAVGQCAELVSTGDVSGLREAIARVIQDSDLRIKLRNCGFERVREFALPDAAGRMKQAYLAVLDEDSDSVDASVRPRA